MYVDLSSRCPVKRSENRLLSDIQCKRTLRLSGSGPEGSKGTCPVLMYDDARPGPYLVEAKSLPYTIVNVRRVSDYCYCLRISHLLYLLY